MNSEIEVVGIPPSTNGLGFSLFWEVDFNLLLLVKIFLDVLPFENMLRA